jgi:hypothetical protein
LRLVDGPVVEGQQDPGAPVSFAGAAEAPVASNKTPKKIARARS